MKRGDVVTIAAAGDYGKPRPALVIQADAFEAMPSVTLLPLTSEIHADHLVRIAMAPTNDNGLIAPSQVMLDKAMTIPRAKVGAVIGRAGGETLAAVNVALARFLGLA